MNRMGMATRRVLAAAVFVAMGGARIDTDCPGSDPGVRPVSDCTSRADSGGLGGVPGPAEGHGGRRVQVHRRQQSAGRPEGSGGSCRGCDGRGRCRPRYGVEGGQAGDLENVDKWVTQMHDVDQPKIDDAVNSVKQAAGG